MSASEWAFALLLRAYPSAFRAAYGREMMVIFRDQRRAGFGGVRFWADCGWDVASSAPALWLEACDARWHTVIQSNEGVTMRMTMAILAIVIGSIEALNAMWEGWAAGFAGSAMMSVTLGVLAGVLLIAAGIALAVRSTRAPALTLGAAITCLAVFVLIGVVLPRMSMFSTMLGIGFPIALLLFLRLGRGRSERMIA